eukprot:2874262-Ditylum_brightwellii.AAC.1
MMLKMLIAKNINTYHTEVPAALIPNKKSTKKRLGGDYNGDVGDNKHTRLTSYNHTNKCAPQDQERVCGWPTQTGPQ